MDYGDKHDLQEIVKYQNELSAILPVKVEFFSQIVQLWQNNVNYNQRDVGNHFSSADQPLPLAPNTCH